MSDRLFMEWQGRLESVGRGKGKSVWESPSNIAFIKYWGKKENQKPVNPSVSMTLSKAVTRTELSIEEHPGQGRILAVNGDPGHPFLSRMQTLADRMSVLIPVLRGFDFRVTTHNTFPHSAGIASSASGMSALALCFLDMAGGLLRRNPPPDSFFQAASYAARLGSGSACRSLYGGYTLWGQTPMVSGSSDEYAVPLTLAVHPELTAMRDAILVISGRPKSLSSSAGHSAMDTHPFLSGRIRQAGENLRELLAALSDGDVEKAGGIVESEALTLHALIMTASGGTLLMNPATLETIFRIREARRGGLPAWFTLDAGANVHLLYPGHAAQQVGDFIASELTPLCENRQVIYDGCGSGPVRQEQNPLS